MYSFTATAFINTTTINTILPGENTAAQIGQSFIFNVQNLHKTEGTEFLDLFKLCRELQ